MRRAGMVLLAALVVLLALAVLADRIAVGSTAGGIVSDIDAGGMDLSSDAEVRIEGFPYLTQLMVGRLQEVNLTAGTAVVEGLVLTDVVGVARDVGTSDPYRARTARLAVTVPIPTIHEALARSALAEQGLEVEVRVDGADVLASTTFLSLPVEARLRPEPEGRGVALGVRSVSLAGITVSAQDMPRRLRVALADLRIPLDALPEGLDVTDVEVLPEGLRLTASGSDLDLGSLTQSRPAP